MMLYSNISSSMVHSKINGSFTKFENLIIMNRLGIFIRVGVYPICQTHFALIAFFPFKIEH